MGIICAPVYANIFMTEFEQKYNYPLIKEKSFLLLRNTMISLWYGPNLKNG